MAIQTRKSNPNKPPRIMIYGPEGVGKSTLGAKADNPVFITPEGGADQLEDVNGNPVDIIEGVSTWTQFLAKVKELATDKTHTFKTLVLDSADWIETLAHAHIVGNSGKTIITVDGGYGSGLRRSRDMHKELIEILTDLREKRNMTIIVTAHCHVKEVKDPDAADNYDGFEIKCHEYVSSLWREWVDILAFAKQNVYVKKSEDSDSRANGDGKRTVYLEKRPAFQAKNRYKMPAEMEFTEEFYKEIKAYTSKATSKVIEQASVDEIHAELIELLPLVTDEKTAAAINKSISDAGQNGAKLTQIRNRVREITNKG
ncbi:hypothetical protein phi1422_0010 [Bdellovibrio phage phi1422]|uniref:Sak4-like ssDNA annealing protein n=1 Tax=Bdellovibrio phage phi1422 TaxID=1127515 RepID=UPI0002536D09|nr:Sak4-like ssDNA annealing protein [Bdellovibrio phage phi1422]AFC22530.1 hypothetical protein phi1422_0010 [Bdellovibrio phage phi1422]